MDPSARKRRGPRSAALWLALLVRGGCGRLVRAGRLGRGWRVLRAGAGSVAARVGAPHAGADPRLPPRARVSGGQLPHVRRHVPVREPTLVPAPPWLSPGDDAAGVGRLDGEGRSAPTPGSPFVRRRLPRPVLQRRPPAAEIPLAGRAQPRRPSRHILHQKFDVPVDFLCYPGGVYDGRVMRAARDAGYLAATSIRYGAATPHGRFALPRIAVYWGESLSTFGSRMRQAVARAD